MKSFDNISVDNIQGELIHLKREEDEEEEEERR